MTDPPESVDESLLTRIRGSMVGMALGDALGRGVQQRELSGGLPGGAAPVPRSGPRTRLQPPADLLQRDAADRRPDLASFLDQHVHLGGQEHVADDRDRLLRADHDHEQHHQWLSATCSYPASAICMMEISMLFQKLC